MDVRLASGIIHDSQARILTQTSSNRWYYTTVEPTTDRFPETLSNKRMQVTRRPSHVESSDKKVVVSSELRGPAPVIENGRCMSGK
jgi:hypothetical protein